MDKQQKRRDLYTAGLQQQMPWPEMREVENSLGMSHESVLTQRRYQSSRVDAVQNVQRTIGALAQMSQQLTETVIEHEGLIDGIDANLDETNRNVEAAQDHLLRFYRQMSSNRGLTSKVFLILTL